MDFHVATSYHQRSLAVLALNGALGIYRLKILGGVYGSSSPSFASFNFGGLTKEIKAASQIDPTNHITTITIDAMKPFHERASAATMTGKDPNKMMCW
jgi:hypothetical protein